MIKQLLEFDAIKDIIYDRSTVRSSDNIFYVCNISHYGGLFKDINDMIFFDIVTDANSIKNGLFLYVLGRPVYLINNAYKVKKFVTDLEISDAKNILKDYIDSDFEYKDFSEDQIDSFIKLRIFK